jgi:two-component system chemotaxis sensor kinase CheA
VTDPDQEVLDIAREEATERLERIERNLLALETESSGPDVLDELFRDAHSIKGAASMVGWDDASEIAHAMEDRLAECRDRGAFPPALADPLLRAADSLRQAVTGGSIPAAEVVEELSDGTEPEVAAPPPPSDHAAEAAAAPDAAHASAAPSIRVAADRIDRVLDGVGEAVLHHRRLQHVLGQEAAAPQREVADEQLDLGERLLGELQDSVVSLRTLPLESITGRFPRAVRDLALAEGKEVELSISGAETPLDRVILDGLQETITHLFRNSIAHGIEEPEQRERAGKPRHGRIELRAEQRGDMVAIEVSDDGRGVAPEVLDRAREAGEPLVDILAAAGFSTAAEVSDVSGRGVGLDAVKTQVEGLGGSLELRSEPGAGTSAIMLLPLTLAVLDVLLCERGGWPFALPVASVREVITARETTSLGGRESVELRGDPVPLRDLAQLIGAEVAELPPQPAAMVMGSGGRRLAVGCDRVLGDQEVVMKGLGPLLSHVPGYLGAAILGDGRVALVLDPNQLLKASTAGAPATTPIAAPEAPAAPPKVLVVDDQFTVRELQRSILETAGYRVQTARDGREALERFQAERDLALVLTDLQMPEMDGIELLRAIRRDSERGSLPVVIVTAMASDDDRRRGVEEGADAYIVKQEFDQQALLETVERLVGR